MGTTNLSVERGNPYTARARRRCHNPVVRAGMSVVEIFIWLAIMALLSIGVLWLLWDSSH